jgi:hypothetical protein
VTPDGCRMERRSVPMPLHGGEALGAPVFKRATMRGATCGILLDVSR